MLEDLKKKVCEANILLPKNNLVVYTWGNVSEIDRKSGFIVIKPSGVEYDKMTPDDMVVMSIDGEIIEGELNPSSDAPTHIELYKNFKNIGGIVHTHSKWATIFAQSAKGIRPYGTTHGDYFHGEIPCTRSMTPDEIKENYELNTGKVIAETFLSKKPDEIPAVLVKNHGPFTWGKDSLDAVHNSIVLEQIAMMAWHTEIIRGGSLEPMSRILLDKHYLRKHGENAYYGQKK